MEKGTKSSDALGSDSIDGMMKMFRPSVIVIGEFVLLWVSVFLIVSVPLGGIHYKYPDHARHSNWQHKCISALRPPNELS